MVGSTSRPSSPSCGEPAGCGGLDSSRLAHNQQHELDRFAQLNDGSFLDRDGQLFWRDDKPKEVKLGKKTLSPVTFGVEPLSGLNNVVSFDGYWIWRRPSLKSKDGPHDSALLCAAKKDGSLWCLGRNESGQLGDGTQTSRLEAKRVEGLENVVQIQLNGHFACARTAGDEVYCWGEKPSRAGQTLRRPRGLLLILHTPRASRSRAPRHRRPLGGRGSQLCGQEGRGGHLLGRRRAQENWMVSAQEL